MQTSLDILHEPMSVDFSYSIPTHGTPADYDVFGITLQDASGAFLDIPRWLLPLIHDHLLGDEEVAERIAEDCRG